MARPLVARIDLGALGNNLAVVRRAAPHARIWSVVKANAYGHGLDRVWSALSQTDGFAMLNLEDAILLRERGWKGPILMMEGFFQPDELRIFDKYRLTTALHSNWQLKALETAKLSAPIDVYLKINSGMNRLGFSPSLLPTLWQKLENTSNAGHITLMTHFADAESPEGVTAPLQCINQAAEGLDCPRSLANSAATLWHPETHYQWVRPGIILYGASPSGQWQDVATTGIQPVMSLESEIIGIQQLHTGSRVGYGGRFSATEPLRIGIVAGGYADGYPRLAPDGTPVWVEGVRTRTVGKISMDMLAVDLTSCEHAGIGSRVELWGKQIKIDDVAASAGTVGYELMCALALRVPVVTH
ncbi:catabolic alanine racemase DadX [Klebsiella sp. BIGb0407]|uniref:catabolic alanine racemase DadX n=1 Tax=Klebsiella sp. BIGb0407 TaxID=2940603 RepID=UPI002169970D|nr:catabolic alanine racemase DadX [Klebsiella sp. BIGb0407]MCS3430350.1 alanine racemase [Klebsiella sp. BIGb0407]